MRESRRRDGFPDWPDWEHEGLGCEWRLVGADSFDESGDGITPWTHELDVIYQAYGDPPDVDPPYGVMWVEARWIGDPQRVRLPDLVALDKKEVTGG